MKHALAVLFVTLIGSSYAMADVKLNVIFTDNMVLQRGKGTPIFGTAAAGEKVTVKVAGKEAVATAGADGKWVARLDLPDAGGPHELVVAGDPAIKLANVMIGEVWMCSGQSNMQFGLKDAIGGPEAIAAANLPHLRMIIAKNWGSGPKANKWVQCDPNNAAQFSAVAFFFGRKLSEDLKVPVGLVINGIGGTPIDAWVSTEGIAADPELKTQVLDAWNAYLQRQPQLQAAYDAAPKDAKPVKPLPADYGSAPGALYAKHLAPMEGFGMKGAIWYQGESDAWGLAVAQRYYKALPALINDWRKHFGKDLAFITIQLPDNPKVTSPAVPKEVYPWKLVQEAQLQSVKMPGVGLAITLDLGENDIHPKVKLPVGERTAQAARAIAYGQKMAAYTGPLYDSMKVEGEKARVHFTQTGEGLVVQGGGEIKGFTIAGEDRHFVWAQAKIDGNSVVVWSEAVPKPAAVRYVFTETCAYNLYGANGIPASPFRTDDWSWNTPVKAPREAKACLQAKGAALWPAESNFTTVHSYRTSPNPTEARFSYDDKNLYVTVICRQKAKITPAGEKNDDDKILSGDFVEVMIDTKLDKRNYVRVTVNPKGLVLDANCFNDSIDGPKLENQDMLAVQRAMDKKWSSEATVKAGEADGFWTAQIAIPWKSLGQEPKAGLKMGLQMERYVVAECENSEWITAGRDRNTGAMMPWPKLYHSAMRFGTLTLE